jgi:Icc-related predicted phosphoesterase
MKKLILFLFVIYAAAMPYNQKMLNRIKILQNGNCFSFAVIGDNRDGDNVLKKIISQINVSNIKFVLNNGDLVPDGYEREFQTYLNIIKTSKKHIVSIIGNHEIPWYDEEKNYKKYFGKTYFSFVFNNSYFIILDDSDEKGIFNKQYQWLKNQLKISQKYQNRFVFMHVPLYDSRKGHNHCLKNKKNAKKLNKLFDKYHVTMLFCSHIHSYFRGIWGHTPYIVTGGAGAPLKKGGFYHYIKVIVNGHDIKYKVIRINAKKPTFWQREIQNIEDML